MKRAKILSASAGSGKTYQLVLKYICDIIERPERYRNILAVTFTNKATEEMKSRILREIHLLASGAKSPYVESICSTLGISEDRARERALTARTKILHDFSRFSVLTIDRFFQRILRAFIKELGLDLNYNIELDTSLLLERSADILVESIAKNQDIRDWLVQYAEERLGDGTRWDMRKDLCTLGKELFKENAAKRMKGTITKDRLHAVVNQMIEVSNKCKQRIKMLASDAITTIERNGLTASDFIGGTRSFVFSFYAYASGELKAPTAKMLKAAESVNEWYKKGASGNVMTTAEELQPMLAEICQLYTDNIEHINTTDLIRDNYRSFALLADLQGNIDTICDEENIMILSETKDILSEFINDNDSNAPFIYEKVGNRYDHYMIDEFQDTSVREWSNMLPLLREALASNEEASVFIVGDIKQSIYRWRGGDWRLLN
ncbi:MAG: UvrD-helicase domain-containing protein, partial [Alistipes sp.]|nr:UvrD-helicase domain-containing protein [Alistipes sp.]